MYETFYVKTASFFLFFVSFLNGHKIKQNSVQFFMLKHIIIFRSIYGPLFHHMCCIIQIMIHRQSRSQSMMSFNHQISRFQSVVLFGSTIANSFIPATICRRYPLFMKILFYAPSFQICKCNICFSDTLFFIITDPVIQLSV